MHSRLVLGCGSLGGRIIDDLAQWPGMLQVISSDEPRIETLREEGIAATHADQTDPETLRSLVNSPDTVFVAGDDATENVAAARVAREEFPDALLVAYTGRDATGKAQQVLSAIADELIDPGRATTAHLMERISDAGIRTRKLLRVLRNVDEPLAIVMHDNPDPDAIASAVALQRLADAAGCEAEPIYFGSITHQENRAFVNLLEFDLRNVSTAVDIEDYGGFALVDHSRPGVNDGLPEDTDVDIVIDHHPPRAPVDARFVDLRSDVGATSTLLVEYLRQLGIAIDEQVATGLLFGIRIDTREFTRETCPADFEAAAFLLPAADVGTLERIESPSISPDTFETLAGAIRNRQQYRSVLLTCVGSLGNRDALAQAADRLLDLDGVTTTLVYGIIDGTVYVSARARGSEIDLGETLRDAFGAIGSAGGHADMAGAQLTLGVLDAADDEAALVDIVTSVITDRFLDAVTTNSDLLDESDLPAGLSDDPTGDDLSPSQSADGEQG
jgi:nanoRNase/pAp phosphatase (c-di-AMP/oligoRNAs hydrolase)